MIVIALLLSGAGAFVNGCNQERTGTGELPEVISPAKASSLENESVPRTLDEALNTLDRASSEAVLLKMRNGEESAAVELHDGLGRWIRNNWQLYGHGPLYQNLAALGLKYPDDMSGLILTSWWRRMHGQSLRIDEQVKGYQDFNKKHGVPAPPTR